MLERVDRIQLAVADAAETARAVQEILGAEPAREEGSAYLNARRAVLALGASEVERARRSAPASWSGRPERAVH